MSKPVTLKDHYRESSIFTSRAGVAGFFVLVLTAVLVSRMVYLQVMQYDIHATKSDHNRINVQPISPTRGLIYDANGTLIADNRASYSISITKERVHNLEKTLEQLRSILKLENEDIEIFHKRLDRRRRPYEPVPIRFNLTEEEIARVAVNQHHLPGVDITADLVRHYPFREITSHALGYVGRINEADEARIDATNYAGTHHIGKIGIERFYEDILHGTVGFQKVETNARGRVLDTLDITPPIPGSHLQLYLDLPTQQAAHKALDGRRGALVAIEPDTGGIIAFASTPSFDANLFVTGIDYKTYKELNTSLDRPLFNRTIQGQYPPGSTIKEFMGLAGLENDVTDWDYTITDHGFYKLEHDARLYRDWKKWGHGKVDLEKAIIQSCDTYFYELAHEMGIDTMHEYLSQFGFGQPTGVDLTGERRGILPSKDWKRGRYNQPWYPGETLIAGIGQGFMLTTPLQLARATAILANRGKQIQPHLVKQITDSHGNVTHPYDGPISQIPIRSPEDWERMIQSMRKVVHSAHGTARKISHDLTYDIAGKTGTAQVLGIKQDEEYDAEKIAERHRDHALFVGFAPVDKPKIAVAVIVENGGGGGSTAAPVAREVMDAYLNPPTEDSAESKEVVSR